MTTLFDYYPVDMLKQIRDEQLRQRMLDHREYLNAVTRFNHLHGKPTPSTLYRVYTF